MTKATSAAAQRTRPLPQEALPKGFGPRLATQQVPAVTDAERDSLMQEKVDGEGFLYVVAHPSWPGKVKIGKTAKPDRRMSAYQVACPTRAFTMVHAEWFPDMTLAEKTLQERLAAYQYNGEWLAADSSFVVRAIKHLKSELMPIKTERI